MSTNPFGNFGGIVIHQEENPVGQGVRKTKREDLQGKPPANKRAALGTITNTTRIQPSRAAKQGGSDGFASVTNENLKAKPFSSAPSAQPFTIRCDDGSSLPVQNSQLPLPPRRESEDKLPLPSAITTFRQPLVDVTQAVNAESPMCLDTSIDQQHKEKELTERERQDFLLTVPEYTEEIYAHLREQELKHRPKPEYMRRQPDITGSMRCILVDWLVEVAEEYKLHRETLFLSVNYIDRFLSQMSVLRGKLQLVGAASMFLAAKYEEIYPPEVGEFVYITDDTYTKKQVLRMEHLVLKVLSFDVAIPTINVFCERFLKQCNASEKTLSLVMYLAELTLVEGDPFMAYRASEIAAGCICLANDTLGDEPWSEFMVEKTGYGLNDLTDVIRDLHLMFQKASSHPQQAVQEKYKAGRFFEVSSLQPRATLPGGIRMV